MLQKIKNYYHFGKAIVALFYFGYPARKLKMIGVTGTDGKTTTVHLISYILKKCGKKVGFISSIEAQIGNEKVDTGFHVTTPEPWQVQKLIKKMVSRGVEYAVLEVTSHGLDQNRVFGCNFSIGVITNVTHEHLDYHKSFKSYLAAKARLFKKTKINVLNIDDSNFSEIKAVAEGEIVTYGIKNNADFTIRNFPFKLRIPGEYNIYNALAAAAATSSLGFKRSSIIKAISEFDGLDGRMESIDEGQDFKVVVDFAHTPNALKVVLGTLRKMSKGRVIAVFGAAGERDFQKRSQMGEIAAELADLSIVTTEDPRGENVAKISGQIANGLRKGNAFENEDFFIIEDRRKAIEFAILEAKERDIVGIFGKGHEESMCFGKVEKPWSDQAEARNALKRRRKNE